MPNMAALVALVSISGVAEIGDTRVGISWCHSLYFFTLQKVIF